MKFRLFVLLLGAASLMASTSTIGEGKIMTDTARRFLDSLSTMQKAVTIAPFHNKIRTNWHYFPDGGYQRAYGYARRGIGYKYLDGEQEKLAENLLRAGLSDRGFDKAKGIMRLEEILRLIEKNTSDNRDQEAFYYSILGVPSSSGTWGWSLEGHHLSLNYTIQDGIIVSSTPAFFGANPHRVSEGPDENLRVLGEEEDKARQFIRILTEVQREQAILQDVPYFDILTLADKRAQLVNEPSGLSASNLNSEQFRYLKLLVSEYAGNGSANLEASRMKNFDQTPREKIFFAWTGVIDPGQGVYYRVQTPHFLIEYANTQSKGNHSHTVWRDWDGDFGQDILANHYQKTDHGIGEPTFRAAR